MRPGHPQIFPNFCRLKPEIPCSRSQRKLAYRCGIPLAGIAQPLPAQAGLRMRHTPCGCTKYSEFFKPCLGTNVPLPPLPNDAVLPENGRKNTRVTAAPQSPVPKKDRLYPCKRSWAARPHRRWTAVKIFSQNVTEKSMEILCVFPIFSHWIEKKIHCCAQAQWCRTALILFNPKVLP